MVILVSLLLMRRGGPELVRLRKVDRTIVKRVDSTANVVTAYAQLGLTLDGVEQGTTTIPGACTRSFLFYDSGWTCTDDTVKTAPAVVTGGTSSGATPTTLGGVTLSGDFGGAPTAPEVVATHLASPLPTAQGGVLAGGTAGQHYARDAAGTGYEWVNPTAVSSANTIAGYGAPTAGVGSNGYYYQQLDALAGANNIWGPKAAGVWPGSASALSSPIPVASSTVVGGVQMVGDFAGSGSAPTVAGVRGVAVSATAPAIGQVLAATGVAAAAWTTPSADIPLSTIVAKGDVITGSAIGAVARTAVGVDGQYLAASSTASGGVAWTTPPTGPTKAFIVAMSAAL